MKLNPKVISDILKAAYTTLLYTTTFNQIDVVYDSYLERSIKECELMRQRSMCKPLEYMHLTEKSPIPVQIDRFWAYVSNKENLQIISRQFFQRKSTSVKIVLNGYVTDEDVLHLCVEANNGNLTQRPDLNNLH